MNSKKRGFELSAAIIAIVLGGLMALIGIFVMFGASFMITIIEQIMAQQGQILPPGGTEYVGFIFGIAGFLVIAYSTVFIVLGSLLCKSPIKDGVFRERKGIKIALLIFLGLELFAIFNLDFLTFISFGVPFGLLLTSLLLKSDNNERVAVGAPNASWSNNGLDGKIDEISRLKNLGIIDDTQYETAVKNLAKEVDTIVLSNKTIDDKIKDLKKLQTIGAITTEEYNDAISKIIS